MKRAASPTLTDHLAALAEPTRLRVLRILDGHELSVGELAQVVQLPQSTVSRHLKVLSDSGWLVRRSEGTATLYRVIFDELDNSARSLWIAVRDEFERRPDVNEGREDKRRLKAVLAARRTDSQTFFGRVAGEWDSLRASLFGDRFTGEALLSLLPRESIVADIGCGTGNIAEQVSPWVSRVIAVDSSQPMLEAARRRLGERSNIDFVQATGESLPLKSSSVDIAIAALVLHHVEEPLTLLREMARITRQGGRVMLIDMLDHNREDFRRVMGHKHLGFARKTIESFMRDATLTPVTFRELSREVEAKGPGLFVAIGTKEP
ncbi:MAG: ArsR family transcriptional regulator [Phycisphaerales bacterium]|nr:ArsR family transcriptional regulator [Phycisphaerales bacterium]